jgi:hypothetical protein
MVERHEGLTKQILPLPEQMEEMLGGLIALAARVIRRIRLGYSRHLIAEMTIKVRVCDCVTCFIHNI